MVRPNLYDDIIGISGGMNEEGQEIVIDRTNREFLTAPSLSGALTTNATGRMFNQATNQFQAVPVTPTPEPVAPPRVTVQGERVTAAETYTGGSGGFTSSVLPEVTTISAAEAMSQAKAQFLETFGSDPNWQAKLAEYQGDVDAAYEAILGEGGPLAEGRRLAEEAFARQTENVRTGFRQSQGQLAEQAFLGERQLQQQLAARGLGGSGLAQLGGVQQQLAQGRASTDLYSQFSRSLENIAASEAKSSQQFAEAESNLRMALSQQKLSLKRDIDQKQQEYNQFKGQTITTLQQAIQSNNYQDYQLAMQDYGLLRDIEQETYQRRTDALAYTTQIITQTFGNLITQAESIRDSGLRTETINQLNTDLAAELDRAGRDLSRFDEGLSPGSLVSEITGRYDFTGAITPTPEPEPVQEPIVDPNDVITGGGITPTTIPGEPSTFLPQTPPEGLDLEKFNEFTDEVKLSLGYQYTNLTSVPQGVSIFGGTGGSVQTTGNVIAHKGSGFPSGTKNGDVILRTRTVNGVPRIEVFAKDGFGSVKQLPEAEARQFLR
jgi:hypothetical protein